jgi:hypothetical protein
MAEHFDKVGGARAQLAQAEAVKQFVLGGRAVFTLVSKRTGTRFTYRVTQPPAERPTAPPPPHFVGLLRGPDNTNDYAYIGAIFGDAEHVKHTRASKVSPDAPSFKAIDWLWASLSRGTLPETVEFWHEGRCCRCGRALTTPESVAAGIGPVCGGRE